MYTDSLNGSQGTKFKQHFWSVFFQFFSSFSWDEKSIRWNSHGTQKKQRRQRWRQHIVYIFILGALTSFILYLDILFHNFLVHSCFLPSLFLKSLSLSSAVAVEVAAAAIFLHFATKYVFLYVQCVRVCVCGLLCFSFIFLVFHLNEFSNGALLLLKVLKREKNQEHESRNEMKVIQVKNRFQSGFCKQKWNGEKRTYMKIVSAIMWIATTKKNLRVLYLIDRFFIDAMLRIPPVGLVVHRAILAAAAAAHRPVGIGMCVCERECGSECMS